MRQPTWISLSRVMMIDYTGIMICERMGIIEICCALEGKHLLDRKCILGHSLATARDDEMRRDVAESGKLRHRVGIYILPLPRSCTLGY